MYVVTHKNYSFIPDGMKFIRVGDKSDINEGCLRDDYLDNISQKNEWYCELTAIYWLWKNETSDIGVCHYRRFFSKYTHILSKKDLISKAQLEKDLERYDIILPRKISKGKINGLFETEEELENSFFYKNIEKAIANNYPEYECSVKKVLMKHDATFWNMFVARRNIFDEYCSWLFPILTDIENNLLEDNMLDARRIGYYAEYLIDIWLDKKDYKIKRYPVAFIEESGCKHFIKSILERIGLYNK